MNESAIYYCKQFIETDKSPQFSVFIKGEWGCGKTYFINSIVEDYSEEGDGLTKKDIIYVSLFGVASTSDIDNKIFQAMHPILSSKGMQMAGTILKAALRLGATFDINNDKSNDLSITLGGMPSSSSNIKINGIKKKLLIIDDIERANLGLSQIFGYFSEIITQSDCKVIFIGDEDQIKHKDNDETYFKKIKEKTIGIEFRIIPNLDSAIDSFLKEIEFCQKLSNDVKNICKEVNVVLDCKNLRTIRQCLFNLKILYESIKDEVHEDHIKDIIRIFIALFIQKSTGDVFEKKLINEATIAYLKHKLSYKKYCDKKKIESKNNFLGFYEKYIPLTKCWSNIIFDGNYSKDYILNEYRIENTINDKDSPKNLFILLKEWRNLDTQRFQDLIELVMKDLREGVYLHPGEILHVYQIMEIFSEWGLIPNITEELFEQTKSSINNYQDKIIPFEDLLLSSHSYGGWGYSHETYNFKEIKKILKEVSKNNSESISMKQINDYINSDDFNVSEFCKSIEHIGGNNKYYMKPILKLIDINKFYNVLKNLSIDEQTLIISSFEERYGKKYSNGPVYKEYIDDLNNLKELNNLYMRDQKPILYNPIEFDKKNISNQISDLIIYFEEKINLTTQ